MSDGIVIIPTYNEIENIESIVRAVFSLHKSFDLLVVDDNSPDHTADKIIALNKMIKAYANKHKIAYADYFSVTVDNNKGLKKEFSGDGVHPNKKGYKAMEPVLEAAIQKTLK